MWSENTVGGRQSTTDALSHCSMIRSTWLLLWPFLNTETVNTPVYWWLTTRSSTECIIASTFNCDKVFSGRPIYMELRVFLNTVVLYAPNQQLQFCTRMINSFMRSDELKFVDSRVNVLRMQLGKKSTFVSQEMHMRLRTWNFLPVGQQ